MGSVQHQSRRGFLMRTGQLTTSAAIIGLAGGSAEAAPGKAGNDDAKAGVTALNDRHYYLGGVRLEEGFDYDGQIVVGTRTGLYTLEIKDGKIAALHPAGAALSPTLPRYDAGGQLALPAMRDMHIHLDKTF